VPRSAQPGGKIINLFSYSLTVNQNKLGRLSIAAILTLSNMCGQVFPKIHPYPHLSG
jgi:hypothetical protein